MLPLAGLRISREFSVLTLRGLAHRHSVATPREDIQEAQVAHVFREEGPGGQPQRFLSAAFLFWGAHTILIRVFVVRGAFSPSVHPPSLTRFPVAAPTQWLISVRIPGRHSSIRSIRNVSAPLKGCTIVPLTMKRSIDSVSIDLTRAKFPSVC